MRKTRSNISYKEIPPQIEEFLPEPEEPVVRRRGRPPKKKFPPNNMIMQKNDSDSEQSVYSDGADKITEDVYGESKDIALEATQPKRRGRKPKKKPNFGSFDAVAEDSDSNLMSGDGDRKGNEESLVDEFDVRGEQKITADGVLLGGRRFRFETFKLPRHDTRFYCFSLDVARCLNYRDSSALFQRHHKLRKVNPTYEDRDYLIEHELILPKNRNRAFGLVTARSIFKMFGYKVIRKGRAVRDDYYVGDEPEPDYPNDYDEDSEEDEDELNTGENIVDFFDSRKRAALQQANSSLNSGSEGDFGNFGLNYYTRQQQDIASDLARELVTFKKQLELLNDQSKLASVTSISPLEEVSVLNKSLNSTRQSTFYEIHSGVTQVRLDDLPKKISIVKDNLSQLCDETGRDQKTQEKLNDLCSAVDSCDNEKYPLALLPQQYQGSYSIFEERFLSKKNNKRRRLENSNFSRDAASNYVVTVRFSRDVLNVLKCDLENLKGREEFSRKWAKSFSVSDGETSLGARDHQHPQDTKTIGELANELPLFVDLSTANGAIAFSTHHNASNNHLQSLQSTQPRLNPMNPVLPRVIGINPLGNGKPAPPKYPPPFPNGMLFNFNNNKSMSLPDGPSIGTGAMQHLTQVVPGNDYLTSTSKLKIDDRPLDTRYNYHCGARNREGYPCRRPVSNAGEKCLYHKKKMASDIWV